MPARLPDTAPERVIHMIDPEVVIDLRDPHVITVVYPAALPHTHATSWLRLLEVLEEHPHHEYAGEEFLTDEGVLVQRYVRLDTPDPLDALTVAS